MNNPHHHLVGLKVSLVLKTEPIKTLIGILYSYNSRTTRHINGKFYLLKREGQFSSVNFNEQSILSIEAYEE